MLSSSASGHEHSLWSPNHVFSPLFLSPLWQFTHECACHFPIALFVKVTWHVMRLWLSSRFNDRNISFKVKYRHRCSSEDVASCKGSEWRCLMRDSHSPLLIHEIFSGIEHWCMYWNQSTEKAILEQMASIVHPLITRGLDRFPLTQSERFSARHAPRLRHGRRSLAELVVVRSSRELIQFSADDRDHAIRREESVKRHRLGVNDQQYNCKITDSLWFETITLCSLLQW